MAAMDVFLLTSLWEGLPRVIPQAMAMKLPVVANRADGTVEAIRHGQTGYLCSPGDIKQMAKYCIELCNNPDLRSEMGHLSNKIAFEEFDLLRMIKQIDNLYLELLRKRNT
jgi:glycosyltransferase involved in cell wall biosynthesis